MKISKIKSRYIFQELFSFISEKKKWKIIQKNKYLKNKLELTINEYKEYFFIRKIKKYNISNIKTFWNQFKNDFKEITNQEENLYNFFLNILSKNKDFILKLSDEYFTSMIKNPYFKENIRVKIEGLNENILGDYYNLDYMKDNLNEYKELNINLFNFFQLLNNKQINKLCLFDVDKKFIIYLNKYYCFQNLKKIELSILHLKILIELKIICPNVEELSININDNLEYNSKEIFNIFPNNKFLTLNVNNKFNLIDIIEYLNDSKIDSLHIIFDFNECIENNFQKEIILKKIKNLRIDLYENNNILNQLFNYIQFPNLENYQLNSNFTKLINNSNQLNKDDFNSVHSFLDEILDKNKFILNKVLELPSKIKKLKYLSIKFKIFSFLYKYKNYLEFYLNDYKYYLNYDLSFNEAELLKYKTIKIGGLHKIPKKYNKIEEIIENENINLCDINLNLNQTKYYIKCFKNVKSIYCEEEIEKLNFFETIKDIILQNKFENLKHLNLTIGNIKESLDDKSLSKHHFYSLLSQLIQNSKNLKSLVLRLHTNNFNQNIHFFLSSIQNLKKLKIFIIEFNENLKYFNENNILDQFPKIKERKYFFEEFRIGNNNNYIESIYNTSFYSEIKTKLINQKIKEVIEDIENYTQIFINDKKINFCFENDFPEQRKYKIRIEFKKLLPSLTNIFSDCYSLTSINLSNINTINVESINFMFSSCISLSSIDLSNFNTNNVIYMCFLFNNCSSLNYINLSNFNTDKVKDMSYMFSYCKALTNIDLSSFNTNNVLNMSKMFFNCSSLTTLNLSNFNTNNVKDISNMFYHCESLLSLNIINFNIKNVYYKGGMFCGINKFCNLICKDEYLIQYFKEFIN